MSILLVSDLHLRGLDDPTQQAFLAFLEQVDFDELVIVGDLFDVWWTFSGAVRLDAVPVLARFADFVKEGRPVTWIAGNHDWAPGVERLGIRVRTSWTTMSGDSKLIAVHGDEGADPRLRNRLLEGVLRSRAARALGRVVGPRWVFRIGEGTAHASRSTGGSDLQSVLLRQTELADRLLGDADVVLVGHSHAPGMLPRRGGTLVNLGDWLQHRSFARVSPDSVRLLHWTGSAEVPIPHGPPQRRPLYMV